MNLLDIWSGALGESYSYFVGRLPVRFVDIVWRLTLSYLDIFCLVTVVYPNIV